MVVVKIEVWPHGDESKKRAITTVEVGNKGYTGDAIDECMYETRIFDAPKLPTVIHDRGEGIYNLLSKVFETAWRAGLR